MAVAVLASVMALPLASSAEQRPANDRFEDAEPIGRGLPVNFNGTTVGATAERGDGILSEPGVWYTWTPANTGKVWIDSCEIGSDNPSHEVAVSFMTGRSERRLEGPTRGCANADTEPTDTVNVRRGTKIYLRVATRGAETTFRVSLSGADGPAAPVEVAHTDLNDHARTDRLPITQNRGAAPRSVESLRLEKLGKLGGNRLSVAGELQVTVCLRPAEGRTREDCVGRLYGYDPRVSAYLALASSPGAARPAEVERLTPDQQLTCTQSQPDRNHHCVIAIPWAGTSFDRNHPPGCGSGRCFVNLIASADHPSARSNENVIVGGISSSGEIDDRTKARISGALYRNPKVVAQRPRTTTNERTSRLAVAREGGKATMHTVYSAKIRRPREGERLVVDGRFLSHIGSVPYNARTRTAIVLTSRRGSVQDSTRRASRVAAGSTRITDESNFNCTQGPSGHSNPCSIRKLGVVRFGRSSNKPLFINLIAGVGAIGVDAQRHKSGDRISAAGGYLKVWRYAP